MQKFVGIFFSKIIAQNFVEISENLRLETECNQRFILHRPVSNRCRCHTWILGQECDKVTPFEKSVFSFTFAKTSRAKNFRLPKLSAPINYDVTSRVKQKANVFCSCVFRKGASKLRNAVGNGECRICPAKTQEFPIFFDKKWPKKVSVKKITARRSTEWCFID